eukprot:10761963-Ditylum_brightwellii.AAC.1
MQEQNGVWIKGELDQEQGILTGGRGHGRDHETNQLGLGQEMVWVYSVLATCQTDINNTGT